MLRYAKLPMDLADPSLAIAAERLASGRILSTDQRAFGANRWKNGRTANHSTICARSSA
jgi:hypothetical protein